MGETFARFAPAAVLLLPLTGCFEAEHPDPSRYEYLSIAGVVQPPYTDFPSGSERGAWKCHDGNKNRTYNCTFVHLGWREYEYVYRRRP